MKTNVKKHRRRSIRLREYDYRQAGAYFITVVTHGREMLFGEIAGGGTRLNELGRIVEDEWQKSSVIRREIELDVFVVMPNHIHGIVNIIDADVGVTGRSRLRLGAEDRMSTESPVEPALTPELPICDAHHHLWVRPPNDYLLQDLLDDLASGHKIVSTVAIECGYGYRKNGPEPIKPVGEVEFLDKVASCVAANPSMTTRIAAAIVGFADLALGDAVAPVLEAELAASPGRFRGIRYSTTWDASAALRSDASREMLADRNFRRGFAWLKKLNLSFDAWLYHPQLAELADLARAFPDVPIILNHIGAPLGLGPYAGKRDQVFQLWSRGIAEVSSCPNVVVKLGGVGSARSGYDWHQRAVPPSSEELAGALKPYFEYCIEKFGTDRCMFESNFPVEKRSNAYVVVWNAFKRLTQNYSAVERASLFHNTAARVYRIA